MSIKRPYALSIAGYDPSGGAGVLADIKTFEAHKVIGLSVVTCITYQTEDNFERADWLTVEQIISQLEILLKKYKIDYCKIGLVQNITVLNKIIETVNKLNPATKIIWDPIFASSSGFIIHKNIEEKDIRETLKQLYLITPNWNEAKKLGGNDAMLVCEKISAYCSVFLKGGHNEKDSGTDFLYLKNKKFSFRKKQNAPYPKHGSGCVLSASLAANLVKGFPLIKACLRAKQYTAKFLNSNKTLLGYHKI